MRVIDLIEMLQDQDEQAEVRVAFQPSWPLRASIQNVVAGADLPRGYGEEEADRDHPFQDPGPSGTDDDRPCTICGGSSDEHPGLADLTDTHVDGDPIVWIAVDQVGSYGEHPYAPKAAWTGGA